MYDKTNKSYQESMPSGVGVREEATMQFYGTSKSVQERSRSDWAAWCQRTRRRPQLRAFAEGLTLRVEQRVGQPRPHVADVVEQAMREAGRSNLTDAQLREVILMLLGVWKHGLALRNWAKRNTTLLRDSD